MESPIEPGNLVSQKYAVTSAVGQNRVTSLVVGLPGLVESSLKFL